MTDNETKQEYYALIGEIITGWSEVEDLCNVALAGMLNISHDMGRSITTPITSFYVRSEILESVAKQQLSTGALDEFREVLGHVRRVYSKRNTIAHSRWFVKNHSTATVLKNKTKVLPDFLFQEINVIQLTGIRDELAVTRQQLVTFMANHALFPPSDP